MLPSRAASSQHTFRPRFIQLLSAVRLSVESVAQPLWWKSSHVQCRYLHITAPARSDDQAQNALIATDVIMANNPLEQTPVSRILDLEGVFSPADLEELNEELALLQQAHGVQCVITTVPSAGPMPPKTFATHLFNTWGIGSPLFNDGLLIILSTKERWW